jgi:hypothetical protein
MNKTMIFISKYFLTPIGVAIGIPFVVVGFISGLLFSAAKQGFKLTSEL